MEAHNLILSLDQVKVDIYRKLYGIWQKKSVIWRDVAT